MYDNRLTIMMEEEINMISIRLSKEAEKQLKEIASFEGTSVSEYVRNIIDEKLEDLYDLRIGEEALREYHQNPQTFSLEETFQETPCNLK